MTTTTRLQAGLVAVLGCAVSAPAMSQPPLIPLAASSSMFAQLSSPRFRANSGAVDYYGAIATASNGAWGTSNNYSTRALAENAALRRCGANCSVKLWIKNACGAVAFNGDRWAWAIDPNPTGAKQRALAALGVSGQTVYTCTTR